MEEVGVAIFAYNRPSHLRRVLIALEDLKIKNIEVFLDGPKNFRDQICKKEILFMLNTNLKIRSNIHQSQKNKGLAKSIKDGLSVMSKSFISSLFWRMIVFQEKNFFKFMYKCLKYFENDKNIAAICGYQIPEIHETNRRIIKAYCLKNFISWGWATWSKKWKGYLKIEKTKKQNTNLVKSRIVKKIKDQRISKKNVWTFDYIKYNQSQNKYFIFPNKSLIKNIGFDGSGVNSKTTFFFNTKYFPSDSIIIDKNLKIDKRKK